ncbi:hypothetical protein F2P81_018174 [Scophthalmus maximus]|uniref:Uncharacterized protein n=1 Tax=Scophthalmus maximus TaxID=52904 RepID=A0A6A4S937_SCOMX|nr:hypothetical protein F2P81_018174 [Scophthalmus maximus]
MAFPTHEWIQSTANTHRGREEDEDEEEDELHTTMKSVLAPSPLVTKVLALNNDSDSCIDVNSHDVAPIFLKTDPKKKAFKGRNFVWSSALSSGRSFVSLPPSAHTAGAQFGLEEETVIAGSGSNRIRVQTAALPWFCLVEEPLGSGSQIPNFLGTRCESHVPQRLGPDVPVLPEQILLECPGMLQEDAFSSPEASCWLRRERRHTPQRGSLTTDRDRLLRESKWWQTCSSWRPMSQPPGPMGPRVHASEPPPPPRILAQR